MVGLLILLLLDPGQHLAETLVLNDGRVAHALQVVKDQHRMSSRSFMPAIVRCKSRSLAGGLAKRVLKVCTNVGRKAFAASMVLMPASRNSFTNRSCSV